MVVEDEGGVVAVGPDGTLTSVVATVKGVGKFLLKVANEQGKVFGVNGGEEEVEMVSHEGEGDDVHWVEVLSSREDRAEQGLEG